MKSGTTFTDFFGWKLVRKNKEENPVITQGAINEENNFNHEQKPNDMNITNTAIMMPASEPEQNAMQLFKNRAWDKVGYEDGVLQHSNQGYKDGEAVIKATYNQLCTTAAEGCRLKLLKSDQDLTDIGPQSEIEAKALLIKKFWTDTMAYFFDQRTKDHTTDYTSECHVVIMTYRSGYNAGWKQYLFNTGE
jgi:hypothetical protein